MSLVLLDTTFLIDAERDGLELEAAINDEDDVAVAAISVAEMLVGVELASTKYRPRREAFVNDVVSSLPIVPYDLSVAGEHARLLAAVKIAGRPRGAHDLIIAATARATNRKVITADPEAFDDLPGVDVRPHR
jgi:tRNA(fMet)-specific endonuclease VapC